MAVKWSLYKDTLKSLRKKEGFVLGSLALLVGLTVALIVDLIIYNVTETTSVSTQSYTLGVLVIHCIGFYLAMIGYVYLSQMKPRSTLARAGMVSVFGHFGVFLTRATVELVYVNYRPEYYVGSRG